MADNSQIQLYKEEYREMNCSTPCSSRSVSPHPGASCSGLYQEPIFTSNRKEEMETENLSTAVSRFGLRSATELVGDKEPRQAPKPAPVATLATANGARGSRDISNPHAEKILSFCKFYKPSFLYYSCFVNHHRSRFHCHKRRATIRVFIIVTVTEMSLTDTRKSDLNCGWLLRYTAGVKGAVENNAIFIL